MPGKKICQKARVMKTILMEKIFNFKRLFSLNLIKKRTTSELIRVSGICVKSAREIILFEKKIPYSNKEHLRKSGIVIDRMEHYIKISGEYQSTFDF